MTLYGNSPYLCVPMSDEFLQLIESNGIVEILDEGKLFFDNYELLNYLYIIISGSAKFFALDSEGNEKIFSIIETGCYFGNTPFAHSPMLKDSIVITLEPTKVVKLNSATVSELLNNSNCFKDHIFNILAHLCNHFIEYVKTQVFDSTKERLSEFLCLSADINSINSNNWYKLNYQFTQTQIAGILNISRTTLQKYLYSLREDGLIRYVNNEIEVKIQDLEKE